MYRYYNYSQTLCIRTLNSNMSYPDWMQFHYFLDVSDLRLKGGVWGWKEAQRQGEDRVTLWTSLWAHDFPTFSSVFLKIKFWANLLHIYGNRMHKTLVLGFFFSLSFHPNSKITKFQVLANYMHFPPTPPTSLMCMLLNCQALLKYGHFELSTYQRTQWRMDGKWWGNSLLLGSRSLANHGGYLSFFFKNHCLCTNNLLVGS
jgi:hypothetical protein